MAYVNYKSMSNNKMLGSGSWLSDRLGTTGAGIGIAAVAIGAAYLGYEYGGAASESLFGSTNTVVGSAGDVTVTTAGSIGTGGFWSTMGDWGTSLWSGLKTVGGGLLDVGKVVLPAVTAIGPGAIQATAQTAQQTAAIKAHEKDVAAAQKAADEKAAANTADIIDYTNSGGSAAIADVAKSLGISPTMVKTIGVAGIGAVALILMITSSRKGA